MRTHILIGALLGTAILLAPTPANADDRGGAGGGAYVNPDGDPTAVAGDGGSGGTGGSSGGESAGENPCEWHVVVEDDFKFNVYDAGSSQPQHSATGRWLEYLCPGVGPVEINGYYAVPEGGLVDARELAVGALASVGIDAPAIRMSPSENGRTFVQVPTWLWLEQGWWQSYEATANAGRVWSTVRATPIVTTWILGDGRSVSCRGPGKPWRPGLPEDASDCTHTYRTSSATRPAGVFKLEATVTFEVSWTSNAAGGGTLPAITRSSTLAVEVGEIQAIGARGGN